MTKYFWCSDAELGHRLARFNYVPSEQQDRGSLSTASQQAALLGSQRRKISPEGRKLSNRLQSSQEVGDVPKDKVTPHRGGSLMVWAFRYTSYGLMSLYIPFSLFVGLYFCQSEEFKYFIPAVSIEYIRTTFGSHHSINWHFNGRAQSSAQLYINMHFMHVCLESHRCLLGSAPTPFATLNRKKKKDVGIENGLLEGLTDVHFILNQAP